MPLVSAAAVASAAGGKHSNSKQPNECVNVRSSNHKTEEFRSYTTLKKLPSANEWLHTGNVHKKVFVFHDDVYVGRWTFGNPRDLGRLI
jgi:hypothetical protein